MTTFNSEQALARFIELHEKRSQEIDQRPDLQRRMNRGDYDFHLNVDYEIQDLETEAKQNGFYLEWTFDQNKIDFEYSYRKMTTKEYEDYLEQEREE